MGLILRSSGLHAAGCYTTTPIRIGARVAEYTGRHRFSTPRRPPRNDTIHY